MAKNKIKPHGTSFNNKRNTNSNVFQVKNKTTKLNNSAPRQSVLNSKFQDGKVIKHKDKVNKTGGKVKKNQVDIQHSNELDMKKKPFDKKLWRMKKYNKKYKLQQWEEKRKKAMLVEYYKQLKDEDDNKKFDVQKIYQEYFDSDEERETNAKVNYVSNPNFKKISKSKSKHFHNPNLNSVDHISKESNALNESGNQLSKKKLSAYQRAQLEYQRIQQEKAAKREEYLKQKAERQEALKRYKKNKMEKYKKLSKKTRKGQPVMKDRMEMLLEKIQSTSV